MCTNKSSKSVYKIKKKCVHTQKFKKWLPNFEKWLQNIKKYVQKFEKWLQIFLILFATTANHAVYLSEYYTKICKQFRLKKKNEFFF